MQNLNEEIFGAAGRDAAILSYANKRADADIIYEAMDRMGVPMRAVIGFFHLEELGNPGDIELTADEKATVVQACTLTPIDPNRTTESEESGHARYLEAYARGCLALDKVLDQHTTSRKPGEIDKVISQRIALILAYRYMEDFYRKFFGIVLPEELGIRTASMTKEAEAFRALFLDHQFEPMDNLDERLIMIRGATHMNDVLREYPASVFPSVAAALAAADMEIRQRELAGEKLSSNHKIGMKIRKARLALNLTQSELATNPETGKKEFSISYVSAVERGQIKPSVGSLERLGKRLGVPYRDLLPEE